MPLLVWRVLLRLALPPPRELELLRLWGARFAARLFAPLLVEREEPLRDAALRGREDPLALVFDPEPFDELLLLCPLREADLLAAIP